MNTSLKSLVGYLFVGLAMLPFWVGAQQRDSTFHIYILMGQSNMAGRGPLTEEYRSIHHDRVQMFTKDQQWVPAQHPVHFDKPKAAGVGPGLSFGMEMAEANPGVTIGLVPCAVGGTTISKWAPGAFDENTKTFPYNDAVARIMEAMKYGVIEGVIWHQGEGDSNAASAPRYIGRLSELINRIRTVVGNPDLPFVVGELGRYRPNYALINNLLPQVPFVVPHTTVVSSEGLWHHGDGTHFDSPSATEYGRRYAAGMLTLQGKKSATDNQEPVVKLSQQEQEEGWELLYDGRDPSIRWRSVDSDRFPEAGWEADGEILTLLPGRKGGDIITRDQFSDFELVFDFKLTDSANTGVKYLVSPLENGKGEVVLNGPEYQLIDDYKHESVINGRSPKTTTASAYLLYRPKGAVLKAGDWNESRIIVKGNHVEHWLNGKKVVEYERGSSDFRKRVADTKFADYRTPYGESEYGHIMLTDHHDAAYFRNIKIRRLK